MCPRLAEFPLTMKHTTLLSRFASGSLQCMNEQQSKKRPVLDSGDKNLNSVLQLTTEKKKEFEVTQV